MQPPLVSAIIIFFNAAPYLEEAIASVRAQTYPNLELVLVDDGSTDGSDLIATAYAAADPDRCRVVHHPGRVNRGMSAARNLGVHHSRGDHIAFLDADDVWLPDCVAEQTAILEREPRAAMVYGPIEWWYSWTGRREDASRDFIQDLRMPRDCLIQPPELLVRFLRRTAAAPSGLLIRRAAFDAVGGFEESFRGTYEDQAFCAKLCLRFPVFVANRCWYQYRQHPTSSSAHATSMGQHEYGRLQFLIWLEDYLARQASSDRAVWRVLRHELWLLRHPRVQRLQNRLRRLARRARRRAIALFRLSGSGR